MFQQEFLDSYPELRASCEAAVRSRMARIAATDPSERNQSVLVLCENASESRRLQRLIAERTDWFDLRDHLDGRFEVDAQPWSDTGEMIEFIEEAAFDLDIEIQATANPPLTLSIDGVVYNVHAWQSPEDTDAAGYGGAAQAMRSEGVLAHLCVTRYENGLSALSASHGMGAEAFHIRVFADRYSAPVSLERSLTAEEMTAPTRCGVVVC